MNSNLLNDFNKGKIVIQSDADDRSTDDVIQWLKHLDSNIAIQSYLNSYNINDLKFELSNSNFEINLNKTNFSLSSNYWYRRGFFHISKTNTFISESIHINNSKPILDFLNKKKNAIQINKYDDNKIGKLQQLALCREVNLDFPDTLITTNLIDVKEFLNKHVKVITKPIENPFSEHQINDYTVHFFTSTKVITKENIDHFNEEKFQPSLFQKYTDKKFEIRSFYLNGTFNTMAIFSQQNEKTKIDYRNYDNENPNRTVPFLLPNDIEMKLIKLMKLLDLNCGSFDLIYTLDNKYVFLEVNPIGQFQWLSRGCNFNIEKLIAKTLLNGE